MNHEKNVREAAGALHKAISEARAAGYAVVYPATVEGLPGIAISETAKVQPSKVAPKAEAKPAASKN